MIFHSTHLTGSSVDASEIICRINSHGAMVLEIRDADTSSVTFSGHPEQVRVFVARLSDAVRFVEIDNGGVGDGKGDP